MRPVAIHHKQRFRRVAGEIPIADAAVREIDGSGDVPGGEGLRAADVEKDKTGLGMAQGLVNVPAVGFKRKQFFEVLQRFRRRSSGNGGNRRNIGRVIQA